jgi:hypothetical protein
MTQFFSSSSERIRLLAVYACLLDAAATQHLNHQLWLGNQSAVVCRTRDSRCSPCYCNYGSGIKLRWSVVFAIRVVAHNVST